MLAASRRGGPHKNAIFTLYLAFLMLLIDVKIGARQRASNWPATWVLQEYRRSRKGYTDRAQSSPSPSPCGSRPNPSPLSIGER